MRIEFHHGDLTTAEQSAVSDGFYTHTEEHDAPHYKKDRVKWLACDEQGEVRAALTADVLWDWIYIDELWVTPELRGGGLGRELMQHAEAFAKSEGLQGLWLWTQSWQGEAFYTRLGYSEFARFENFPKGHARVGFRKTIA